MNNSSENSAADSTFTDRVVRHMIRRGITLSSMESCTGGLFASAITDTEGASDIFFGSFVTYSNEAKERMGVPAEIIERCGVYSAETAEAMAGACRSFYHTDIGVGITGSTGNPDPNNADSVPGEVFYAILLGEERCVRHLELAVEGLTRHEIKERIVDETVLSLAGLLGIEKG